MRKEAHTKCSKQQRRHNQLPRLRIRAPAAASLAAVAPLPRALRVGGAIAALAALAPLDALDVPPQLPGGGLVLVLLWAQRALDGLGHARGGAGGHLGDHLGVALANVLLRVVVAARVDRVVRAGG